MRSIFYPLLSLATIAFTLAGNTPNARRAEADDGLEDKETETIFNGQPVPPMTQLTAKDLDTSISHGNWVVEFYSPYCPHCMHFKPTYQTAYEFYYTSKTVASKDDSGGDSLNSFTRYYDFKFAKVDCIVNADMCRARTIEGFPTMVYFVDGKEMKREAGSKNMQELSTWVEGLLESIRPGSRKEGGPKLPKAGSKSVEVGPETEEVVKEQQVITPKAEDKKETATAKEETTPSSTLKTVQSTTAAKPKPVIPVSNANPLGAVEVLTAEKFQKLITNTLDPWFIKFYAPWCHHCQALAPTWSNMARQMQGKLNVGEVNCDVEKRLCKEAGVRGYPTMLFFRGGERIEYEGLRGLGDLLDYANRATAIGAGVPDVDLESFKKMEETEEVIFVYFYDVATTTEDFQALDRLTLSLVGHAKMVKTNDKAMSDRFKISTWPRMMVSRDGKPSYYPPMTPKDMRDTRKVLTWMKSVWLPIVPEMTSSNAREIMSGKLVVLGILSRERSDEFILSKREMKSAALEWIEKQDNMYQLERQELRDAKQLRIEEAEDKDDERALRNAKGIRINMDDIERTQVGFAWVDGVFWERWVRTTYGIDVKDGERVIINDEDNRRYWDNTISGEPIRPSRTSILETIGKVTANPPKIPSKSTTGAIKGFFLSISDFCANHPFLSLGLGVAFVLAASLFGKSRMRKRGYGNTGSFFQLGEKEGLLGVSNGNGLSKHD